MQLFDGQIRFGIHSGQQNVTYQDYLGLWQRAEELGYDWVSCFDHFLPIMSNPEGPCFEGPTILSAMAALTNRVRCGIIVTSVTYRNPAVLANIATTIDHVSNGRLELGMGAGWYELEHDEYGIPFPPAGTRIRMLGEAAKVVKSLWTQQRTTFKGRHYTITDALSEPKPVQKPHIPLWIGGGGEKLTLRVVAESADGWNTFYQPVEEYRRKLDALAGHCQDVGREPGDIRKAIGFWALLGETEQEVEERIAEREAQGARVDRERNIVGTPEQCVERLRPFLQLGVGDFLFLGRAPYDWRTIELVIQQVAPGLKG